MQRRIDVERLKAIRRIRGVKLQDIATALGYSAHTQVSSWLKGQATPPPEKLPALADALGEHIDDLFPREGEPDLADLRCDAGVARKDIPEILGTRSSVPVSNAERGKRRLDPAFVGLLAEAYGVTADEVLAAQNRSFGETQEAQSVRTQGTPTTLAEKINYLLTHLPADRRPTDLAIAEAVNETAGVAVIRPSQVKALRTEDRPVAEVLRQVPEVLLYEGLAATFGVPPHYFQSDGEMVQQVIETIRFLAQRDQVDLQARGAEEGLSGPMLAKLNDLLDEARKA